MKGKYSNAATSTATTTTTTTSKTKISSSSSSSSNNNNNKNNSNSNSNHIISSTTMLTLMAASNIFDGGLGLGLGLGLSFFLINDSTTTYSSSSLVLSSDTFNLSEITGNGTGNLTNPEDVGELIRMAATSVILGLMILMTIIGNVFVIAAIILERNLQNVANYLVASLAVADLFVACLVMPLGAVYEISQGWILGPELCDIWTSCDVLCCTASILHLVAIAVDRYWAVTNIDYIHSRSSRRVFLMIFCVWTAAVIVSLAPQFGWKDPDYLQRIEQQKCMVSQDVAYQVFATCCTFYVPLLVILVLYWKIYQTARKRIHRRRPKPTNTPSNNNQLTLRPQKKRKRLRLRIGRQIIEGEDGVTTTTVGLIDGNSTNTVNTMEVEDTEFSSSNMDSKSRAGNETAITTNIDTNEEIPTTPSSSQIATVSHLVALAHQEQKQHSLKRQSSAEENPLVNNNKVDITTVVTTTSDNNGTPSMELNSNTNTVPNGATTEQQVIETIQVPEVSNVELKNADMGEMYTKSSTTAEAVTSQSAAATTASTTLAIQEGSVSTLAATSSPIQRAPESTMVGGSKQHQPLASIANPLHKVTKRKETLEAKRERKAAKTLAIITGAFVVCWLPFFVMALLLPLCEVCQINDNIASLFLWLGYFNSTLNPVIYTIFSPEFRQAFKRILFGGHRPVHYRIGKI